MNATALVRAMAEKSAHLQRSDDPTERMLGEALFRICNRALEISQEERPQPETPPVRDFPHWRP